MRADKVDQDQHHQLRRRSLVRPGLSLRHFLPFVYPNSEEVTRRVSDRSIQGIEGVSNRWRKTMERPLKLRSVAAPIFHSERATWRTSDFDNGPRGEVSGTALNSTSLFPTIMALFDRKAGMQLIALWVRAEKNNGKEASRMA